VTGPSVIGRRATAILAIAAMVATVLVPAAANAAAPLAPPRVSIETRPGYVERSGNLDIGVTVTLLKPASRMSVRLRLLSDSGAVLFQKTEARTRLGAQTYLVDFRQDMSPYRISEGPHTLEIRTEASGHTPVTTENTVLVVDQARPPVPLAVVIRLRYAPMTGPTGALIVDPAVETGLRSEAEALTQLATVRPDIKITVVAPPVMLDEWRVVGGGYVPPGAAAEAAVPADAATPAAYRGALAGLGGAAAFGTRFLAAGYADPDLEGLGRIGAMSDLAAQLTAGKAALRDTLGSVDTPGVAVADGLVPASALPALSRSGARYVLVSPASVRTSANATTAPGAYAIRGTTLCALVTDARASALLGDAAVSRDAVLAHLFDRTTARAATRPIVAVVDVGPGAGTSVSDLQATLAALQRVRWVRLIDTSQAAELSTGTVELAGSPVTTSGPAPGYWETIAQARARRNALASITATDDPDAVACARGLMIAESRVWTGSGDESALAQGLAYAAAADSRARAILDSIKLTSPNVTLSATTGRVRVSVQNGSRKPLRLALKITPSGVRLPSGTAVSVDAPPGESILTVPVDLGASLSATLSFRLLAGSMELATARSTVRASYIDRLVLFATIVLVLLLLLWYIRRRGHRALALLRRASSARGNVGRDHNGGRS
jgi:hypothetical protein